MRPDQVATVRRTFRLVEPIQGQVAVLFYRRLAVLDPRIALQFEHLDIDRQREGLMQTLSGAVRAFDQPAGVESEAASGEAIVASPELHRVDGAIAGMALVWALGHGLGAAFTADVEAAWRAAFGLPPSRTIAVSEPERFRRPRRPASSRSRASGTPRPRPPAPPA